MPKPTIKVYCFHYKCIAIASVVYYNPQSILVILPINIEVFADLRFLVSAAFISYNVSSTSDLLVCPQLKGRLRHTY